MANWKARSSDAAGAEYQVFLNFRGYDTRYSFTDFLYDRLVDAGVNVFMDEEKLPRGDVISEKLERAINNSTLYISIFSPDYASSKWCLDELKLIIDNVSNSGDTKSILPIFFLVKSDDVKLKTRQEDKVPLYDAAFKEHEKNFTEERVKAWKTALGKAGKHKGWTVEENTRQAETIKLVVQRVLDMLKIKKKLLIEHLVGLDDRVKDLIESVDVNHPVARLIVIYGMGGIGKTTIAKKVFNQLSSHFGKRLSFLEDIRTSSSTKEGIVQLQKRLLSDIVDSQSAEYVEDSEQGMQKITKTLPTKKVLVVLDDVHNKEHIKILIGNSPLHPGSRIIVTTREKTILQVEGFEGEIREYEMPKMDYGHALKLFCRHAFGTDLPPDDFHGLSRRIVPCMGGLPLAIRVIGSLLKGEEEEFWKETLVKLREVVLEDEILKVLRISYDDLKGDQQQIFLDIACFLVNEKKTDAIYMWAGRGVYPIRAIKVLIERCLIKILDDDKFWMHDQLINLGRHIVCEESLCDLGKRSRLWITKEANQIIRTNETKDKVQALCVRIPEIGKEDFQRLPNLRFLKLTNGTYVGDFASYPSNLKWLSWSFPPEKNFGANNLYLDRLVICKLYGIDFKDDSKSWHLIKRAQDLKVLSITRCHGITTIPDVSKCSGIERLTLEKCENLSRIESFIGDLKLLIEVKIKSCKNLIDLPEEIGTLVKLQHFSLSGSSKLRKLPSSIENLTSLTELDLSDTIIRELPNSIGKLKSLRILRFQQYQPGVEQLGQRHQSSYHENHDWQLPNGISTLINLEELDLSGHNEMIGKIPNGLGELTSLRILNLKSTGICGISRTINMLHHLQTLNLANCHKIQELPELPPSLTSLYLESESLLSVPNLSNLTSLDELVLSNFTFFGEKSKPFTGCNLRWIGRLSRLKKLQLCLLDVPATPELASLSHLEELVLTCADLKPLAQLPSSDWSWSNLSTLRMYGCEGEYIPLERLPQLETLTVTDCLQLQRLSIPLELRKLQRVSVSICQKLVEIQVVGHSKSLESLRVERCRSLMRISGLSYLKSLKTLTIKDCYILTNVEGLNELKSLKKLDFWECPSLESLIDASCVKIPENCIAKIWTVLSKEISFIIEFHLGVKKSSEGIGFVGGIKKEKNVTPDLVTYEGLTADVKKFGFHLKRMWYKTSCVYRNLHIEIKSDEQVKEMVQLAPNRETIHLYIEGEVDSEWEGEYDDEIREMLTEERKMKTDVSSDEEAGKGDVSCPTEDSNSASVGESETHGTSSIDDFELKPGRKSFRQC